jgi:ornithine decarboxylase
LPSDKAELSLALGQQIANCDAETIDVFLFCWSESVPSVPSVSGYVEVYSADACGAEFSCSLITLHCADRGLHRDSVVSTATPSSEEAGGVKEALVVGRGVPQLHGDANPLAEAAVLYAGLHGSDADCAVTMLDLSALEQRHQLWRSLLPRVDPFYAVKCNPTRALVSRLWQLFEKYGGGFDCATPAEIALVKELGAPTDRIIYAHPCKQISAICSAQDMGVHWTTFDNEAELVKIKQHYPSVRLVLRVQTDDAAAKSQLSNKFGAAPSACRALLQTAVSLGLEVVGVSFHVGSNGSQRGAFRNALERARRVFDMASEVGCKFSLLDVGGGFPGVDAEHGPSFADYAEDINAALQELFPDPHLRVIAEPGRFFATQAQAVLAQVTCVADVSTEHGPAFRYYINDGVYGSFNCLVYDHFVVPCPIIIRDGVELEDGLPTFPCTLFGPTCDGFDMLSDMLILPRLFVGDRLVFKDMGAYTASGCTTFNGFPLPRTFVYRSTK